MSFARTRGDIIATIALVAVVLVAFVPFVFGGRTLQDSVASAASLYPTGSRPVVGDRMRVSRSLDAGAPAWFFEPQLALEHDIVFGEHHLPTWNPYAAYGAPLLANMQSQPLTPVAWLAIGVRSAAGYDAFLIMRLLFAVIFTYAFARLFFGPVAAFCGALSYGFCGYFMLYIGMPEQSVHVVAPALFLAIESYARRRSFAGIGWIAVAVALVLLGGMPESAFLFLVVAALYAVVRRASIGSAIGMLLGCGVAAVAVFPFVEYVRNAYSAHGASANVGLLHDSLSLETVLQYVAPLLVGPPHNDVFTGFSGSSGIRNYYGVATILFALAGLIDVDREPIGTIRFPRVFFAIVPAVLLLKRFGFPGIQELGELPVFRQIIFVKYDEPVMAFCIAVLAALGVERLLSNHRTVKPAIRASVVLLGTLILATIFYRDAFTASFAHGEYVTGSLLVWAMALLSTIVLIVSVKSRAIARGTLAALAGATFTGSALLTFVVPMYWLVNANPVRDESTLRGAPYVRAARDSLADGHRFFSPDALLYPEWSAAFGIADVRSLDALYTRRYLPFVRAFLHDRDPTFLSDRFTGDRSIDFEAPAVRHWLSMSSIGTIGTIGTRSALRGLRRRTPFYSDGDVRLYRVKDTLPIVSAFSHFECVATGEEALGSISRPSFDPLTSVVVERSAPSACFSGKNAPYVSAHIDRFASTYLRASIAVRKRSFLMDTQTNYPGWNAYVDGRPQTIENANYLFRGFVIAPGRHMVEFDYQPSSLKLGIIVSVVSMLILGVLIVSSHTRRQALQ